DLKKNLNIDIKISKLDYTTFYGRYAEGKWDGMAWGFKTGYATGLDEQTYQYMHSKSTKNYWRFSDPVIDELVTQQLRTPDRAEQRALTKKVLEREHDQVTRMWMPYDSGFLVWQPNLRNTGSLALRRNDGYGASTLARLWIDKEEAPPRSLYTYVALRLALSLPVLVLPSPHDLGLRPV